MAQVAQKFSTGDFEHVEKARVINVIPHRAERVADAMLKAKDLSGHGLRINGDHVRRQ